MSSTEICPTADEPLAGLFENQLGAAVRAYGRRGAQVASAGSTLAALKAIDQRLDALVATGRYYRESALQRSLEAYEAAPPGDAAGSAFAIVALAQTLAPRPPNHATLVARFYARHPEPTRDALWFFGDTDLCRTLLEAPDPGLRMLGIELSGRLALAEHAPRILSLAASGADLHVCLLACARMGRLPRGFAEVVRSGLRSADENELTNTLEALAVSGAPFPEGQAASLIARLAPHPDETAERTKVRDTAFATWAVRHPDEALPSALSNPEQLGDTALRVIALAGRIEGLFPVCRDIEQQEEPPTPAQCDVLQMMLGHVPAELRLSPGDPASRSRALRAFVAQTLHANGCPRIPPEAFDGWEGNRLQEHTWPMAQVRLRRGGVWRPSAVLAAVPEVTHPMRRWLYFEQAAVTRRPLALSHQDLARRQYAAIESVSFFNDLSHLQ